MIVSRLGGSCFQAAMEFRLERSGTVLIGDDAVCAPHLPATVDVHGHVTAPEQPAGITVLLQQLRNAYELHDQDRAGIVLDEFFDVR